MHILLVTRYTDLNHALGADGAGVWRRWFRFDEGVVRLAFGICTTIHQPELAGGTV